MAEETELREEKNENETEGPRPLSTFLFAQNSDQTPVREQGSGPEAFVVAHPQVSRTYIAPIRRSSSCERIDYPFYDLENEETDEEFPIVESIPESTAISIETVASCDEQPSLTLANASHSPSSKEKIPPKEELNHSPKPTTAASPFFSCPLEATSNGEVPGIYRRYLELVRHRKQIEKLQTSPLPPLAPNDPTKNVETDFSKEESSQEESPLARIEQIQKILTVLPDASKETLLNLLLQLNLAPTDLKNEPF